MKQTAVAPSNIAFIKYWGKIDEKLRIPSNDSISMNLSGATTTTTVEFSPLFAKDTIEFIGGEFHKKEIDRIVDHLDRIRARAKTHNRARVVTKNSFPKGTGIASSASGFAALTVAGAGAAGLALSEKERSVLARLGSGSACRSVPDGFVRWNRGTSSEQSYAHSLFAHTYWDVRDILIVVDQKEKTVSSAEGMKSVKTSPFWEFRQKEIEKRAQNIIKALEDKNFPVFGQIVEEDCLSMHAVMMTQSPSLYYWNTGTRMCLDNIKKWQRGGLSVYFTIDAGPNVHCICEAKDERRVLDNIHRVSAVQSVLVNHPAAGAHTVEAHLF
jgi:diphosphomevalonate decarboxylase